MPQPPLTHAPLTHTVKREDNGSQGQVHRAQTSTAVSMEVLNKMVVHCAQVNQTALQFLPGWKAQWVLLPDNQQVPLSLVDYAERVLALVLGTAAAKFVVGKLAASDHAELDQVMLMIDEAAQRDVLHHCVVHDGLGEEPRDGDQLEPTTEAEMRKRAQELENLNRELVIARKKAEYESHSKSRFLAAVSHDLMQPLSAARLFTSSLLEVSHDPHTQEVASHIESSLGAAEDLIGDLLDISRLESGKLDVNVYGFALNEVLGNLQAEFAVLANQQGIDFTTLSSSLTVRSDPKLLRRVIQNFLTNAFRYNPNGKVLLGVRRKQGSVRLEVWDNGPGIDEEQQKNIFEEFTRGGSSEGSQGLGLGLAISKGISHVLGHQISMRTWAGRGSVFSISLPSAGRVEEVLKPVPSQPVSNLSHLKILCIDNEQSILLAMQGLLTRWGCDVKLAENEAQSLACVHAKWQPDVVLSDYHLDCQKTGLSILKQLKATLDGEFLGAIISADCSEVLRQEIRSQGFDFVAKPLKAIRLRSLLNQWVI